MKRSRSRIATLGRIVGFVGVFPALVVVALLVFDFSIPVDGLRGRVGAALSGALGCPVTIAGSLHLVTGTRPGLEGRDVRLAECRPIRVARASASMVRARVDLWALFSHEVRLVEISGERLEVEVPTEAPAPAAPGAGGPSAWTFTGISLLRITPARLLVRSASAPPRSIDLSEIEGSARADKPMQLTLRGMLGTESWAISADTASLRSALAGPERWPLDLMATYGGAKLSLHGSWSPTPIGVTGDLEFAAATPEKLFREFGVDAFELGAMRISGRLTASRQHIALETMNFTGPLGAISGDARVTGLGGRLMIDASLRADTIDYAAFQRWRLAAASGAGQSEATAERVFAWMRTFDADIVTSAGRLANAPFSASDVKHTAALHAGLLKITSTGIVDGAPSEVSLEVDARGPYAVEGHASVKSLPRMALTQARDLAGIDSRIGGLSATFSAHGVTIEALLKDAHGQLTGKDIKLVPPWLGGGREVQLRIIQASAGRGEAVRASTAGTLAGEPLAVELVGGPLVDLLENRTWAIARLGGRVGAARIRANGRIEQPNTTRVTRLDFELTTSRLDQLGLLAGTELPRVPGNIRGSLDYGPETWGVDATTLAIGATRGRASMRRRAGAPIEAMLDLDMIAVDELVAAGTGSEQHAKDEASPTLPDMDVSLKARAAEYAGEKLDAIALDVRLRDGVVRGPFSLGWVGAQVAGTLDAEFGKGSMRVGGEATARGLEVIRLPGPLRKQGITGKIERVAARIEASGASLAELTAKAAFSVEVADADVLLPKSDVFPEGARCTFGGRIQALAAAPIDFSVKGAFRDKPFAVAGQLPPLDALFPESKPHAVRLAIDYDRTRLEAAGEATVDNDAPRFSGTLKLSGATLHTLAELAGFSAHGFGPYTLSATVNADLKQVSARDVAARLGKSEFRASLAAQAGKARPRIAAKLSGSPVHLEDIGAQAWSPENLEKRAVEEKDRGGKVDEAKLDRDARLLARALRAFDFDLDLVFDEVASAGKPVGRAEIKAQLADGQLTVNPISMWIDQGKISAEIGIDARGKVPQYTMKFAGSDFNYGPIMRAVDPKSPVSGTLDLRLDLKTSGAPEAVLRNANGSLDLLVLPKDQQAGALGALGAGVLRLLMRTLDPRSDSQLNCVVGSFDIADGTAKSRIVLLDTTRARVAGDLEIDAGTLGLKGNLAPRSKQPQLFPVVPGIAISGTLDDPKVGVTAQSVAVSMLRIWQVPITFASDWVSSERVPPDGTPGCRAAYLNVVH